MAQPSLNNTQTESQYPESMLKLLKEIMNMFHLLNNVKIKVNLLFMWNPNWTRNLFFILQAEGSWTELEPETIFIESIALNMNLIYM